MKKFFYPAYCKFYIYQIWRERRFSRAGLLVLISIIASAILGLDTRQTLTYEVFAFLAFIMGISIVWSIKFNAHIDVHRFLPKFGTLGEPFIYSINVQNKSKKIQEDLYLFEDFQDPRPSLNEFLEISEPFENKRNRYDRAMGFYRFQWLISKKEGPELKGQPLPKLLPGKNGEIEVKLIPVNRGRLKFTGVLIARPDPFGLFYSFIKVEKPQSVVILPKRYTIAPFHLPGIRRYHTGGVALTASVGESEEFISLRDYRPGDSLRGIHWKSWARTGKPVVKEYQDEFFVRHALILDTFQKTPYSTIFEAAISVAASFVCSLENQETLLDLIFVGLETYCFTTGRGLSHTDKILEILADVKVCQDKPFNMLPPQIIERANMLSGCICILLSWDDERKDFIKQLRNIGLPLLVLVIADPSSSSEPPTASDPGPMKDQPENFHVLYADKLREGLLKL